MIYIKTASEVEKIRAAGAVIVEIFKQVEELIKPGISTQDIDDLVSEIIGDHDSRAATLGYGVPPFPASCCTSVDEEIVHGIPSKTKILEDGQIVSVDVVVEKAGYMADACRTFPVGEVSAEKKQLMKICEASFWAGFEQAKVGNRIRDISAAVQEYVEAHDCSVIMELTGHGIGRSMHEAPDVPNFVTPFRGPRLEEGLVICVEPMISLGERHIVLADDGWTYSMVDGATSCHYENTIVITNDGPENLTPFTQKEY